MCTSRTDAAATFTPDGIGELRRVLRPGASGPESGATVNHGLAHIGRSRAHEMGHLFDDEHDRKHEHRGV